MELFTKEQAPRRKNMKRMQFQDVGMSPFKSVSGKEAFYVYWKCPHCNHDAGWCHFEGTVSDVKRGEICPKCNSQEETAMTTTPASPDFEGALRDFTESRERGALHLDFYTLQAIEIALQSHAACKDDPFDSMNDFRLQEIAVLKNQIVEITDERDQWKAVAKTHETAKHEAERKSAMYKEQTACSKVEVVTEDKREILAHALYQVCPKVSFQHILIVLDKIAVVYPNGVKVVVE